MINDNDKIIKIEADGEFPKSKHATFGTLGKHWKVKDTSKMKNHSGGWNKGKTKKDFPNLGNGGCKKGHVVSEAHRIKISLKTKGVKKSLATREKMSKYARNRPVNFYDITWKRIMNEVYNLEKQGFRCIPIGRVIPDIVAIKDNKVYAIEVEYKRVPDYDKYDRKDLKKYYDEIMWIIKNKQHNYGKE
jgi:hypothetical protein